MSDPDVQIEQYKNDCSHFILYSVFNYYVLTSKVKVLLGSITKKYFCY